MAEQQAREALASQPPVDEPAETPKEESKSDEPQRVGQLVQLVWYDEYSVARIRRNPEWALLLEDLEQQYDEELDDPDYSDEPADVEDRREIYEILSRGKSTDPEMMRTLLLEGIRQGGKVKLPLVLVEGELSFDFDELAELGAVVTTATPYIGDDEALEAAIDEANEFLEYANPPVGPKVCRAFTDRVRKAFAAGERPVDEEYFEEQVNRALLTGQCYQLRDVLGERHVRGGYMPDGASARKAVLPCYLPEDMAPELPMFRTFRASMVAELNVREDQYETHPAALRVLAIARVMKTPSGW